MSGWTSKPAVSTESRFQDSASHQVVTLLVPPKMAIKTNMRELHGGLTDCSWWQLGKLRHSQQSPSFLSLVVALL